jgi:hypothetical protein
MKYRRKHTKTLLRKPNLQQKLGKRWQEPTGRTESSTQADEFENEKEEMQ